MKTLESIVLLAVLVSLLYLLAGCTTTSETYVIEQGTVTDTEMLVE